MKGGILATILGLICMSALCSTDAVNRIGVMMERCVFEPRAEVMVLRDEADLSLASDYNFKLDRKLTLKFFKDRKIDKDVSDIVFFPSDDFDKYKDISVNVVSADPDSKVVLTTDVGGRVNSTHMEESGIRVKAGALLEVTYTVRFAYNEKLPDWRFQSRFPTQYSSMRLEVPEVVNLTEHIQGNYKPELMNKRHGSRQMTLNNESQKLKFAEHYYQFSELPSQRQEPFSDYSPKQLAHLQFHIQSVKKNNDQDRDFKEKQVKKIVEVINSRPDLLPRLSPPLLINNEYESLIDEVGDEETRIARIYDLVRRHMVWNREDSLRTVNNLNTAWISQNGNSSEINLILVKLLRTYGCDADPVIVCTRNKGLIDTDDVALNDFNRVIASVKTGNKRVSLDATAQYHDYPMLPSVVQNTKGLLIGKKNYHWIDVMDSSCLYRNKVILLGHLSPDSRDTNISTKVFINSSDYAKAEHTEILARDSVKGLRRYFEKVNRKSSLKHFVVANQYVDTLPLAQEFDVKLSLGKKDNLCAVVPTMFSVPDTLFTITDDRQSDIDFGYKQNYELVSEFSFPPTYQVFLVPENVALSGVNGSVTFERDYHQLGTSFSLRQTLIISKTHFNITEAIELGKFLKRVRELNTDQVMLKKIF